MPMPGSPEAKEAAEDQIKAANKRRSEQIKELEKARSHQRAQGLPLGAYAPPDPDESENVAHSGKFDETVEGGRYLHPDGKYRDAEGRVLKK
jgi:hypothetical protein